MLIKLTLATLVFCPLKQEFIQLVVSHLSSWFDSIRLNRYEIDRRPGDLYQKLGRTAYVVVRRLVPLHFRVIRSGR